MSQLDEDILATTESRPATMRDVAQAAGVSIQTVSNVIHGKSFVRPEVKRRVWQVINQLDYHPNRIAQGMRRQASQALGFFISDPNPRGLADPYYGEVLAGLAEVTRVRNYSLLLNWLASDQPLQAQDFLHPFRTRQIDAALIFLPGEAGQHQEILDELMAANILFVILEQEAVGESVYSLLIANYEGAYAATQSLISAGHQQIIFLDSTQRWPNIDQRWQGYQAAMREAGLEQYIAAYSSPDWTAEGGTLATAHLLETSGTSRPTAIVAANDILAVGAMHAIKTYGLRIPGDVAIIGFDDFEFTRYVDPPMTTVRLPAQELGRRAAELLINHLEGQPATERRVVLPTELVLRQST